MTPQQAYRKVRTAIENGLLTRPIACERCGDLNKKCSDGRSLLQAHHHDYNKPLEVEWICAKCHRKETPLPKIMGAPTYGSKNGASKLTESDICKIREDNRPSRKIASDYGVEKTTILRIKSRERWLAAAPEPPT